MVGCPRLWGEVVCVRYMKWLLVIALVSGLVSGGRPAAALSCVRPIDRLDKMDLVIQGTITEIPQKQWALVKVERYFRGTGPEHIQVEYRGIGGDFGSDRYAWAQTPVQGMNAIIELGKDAQGYYTQPCGLILPVEPESDEVKQALAALGEGTAPEPGTSEPSPSEPAGGSALLWFGVGAGALLAVAAGAWWIYRTSRKRAA